jgi:hypothetical protein
LLIQHLVDDGWENLGQRDKKSPYGYHFRRALRDHSR